MSGFLNVLSDFLESDLAKSYGWVIFFSFIVCLVIGWCIIGFIFEKIIVPSKTLEASEIKQENLDLVKQTKTYEEEIKKLRKEIEDLEKKLRHFRFQQAIEDEENDSIGSKALKKFTK